MDEEKRSSEAQTEVVEDWLRQSQARLQPCDRNKEPGNKKAEPHSPLPSHYGSVSFGELEKPSIGSTGLRQYSTLRQCRFCCRPAAWKGEARAMNV